MMLGTFALLITFSYYPAFSAVLHSFTVWDGFRPAQWTGISNYQEVFTSEMMGKAFVNMALLVLFQVFRAAVFPLLGAALIYRLRQERVAYAYRLVFVLPIVVPATVTILVWRQFFDPNVGLLNEVLRLFGLNGLSWLNSESSALFSLMFIGFPWIDGVGMLIYLAGLLAIPTEVTEAAIMDGASSLRRFFSIELPLVIPQIRLIVILNVIGALAGLRLAIAGDAGRSEQRYRRARLGNVPVGHGGQPIRLRQRHRHDPVHHHLRADADQQRDHPLPGGVPGQLGESAMSSLTTSETVGRATYQPSRPPRSRSACSGA